MPEFTPISTQEELDAVIGERIARERAKYADYKEIKDQLTAANDTIAGLNEKISGHKTEVDGLNAKITEAGAKIKGLEMNALKDKVIREKGLPHELSEYLKGETEEELMASADVLGKLTAKKAAPPLADPEGDPPSAKKAAALETLKKMRGE